MGRGLPIAPSRRIAANDLVPFPEDRIAEYRQKGAWGDLTIAEEFTRTASRHPSRPALSTPSLELTYAELDRQTDVLAGALNGLGLEPGERVLLQVTNVPWAVIAWYGLLKAGLIPIATLAQHREHEIFEIARQAEPAAHLIQANFSGHSLVELAGEAAKAQPTLRQLLTINTQTPPAGAVSVESLVTSDLDIEHARSIVGEIQRNINPADLAVLQLSGGTTSVPKLIPRLHAEYWFNARRYAEVVELEPDSCVTHLLPVVHNAGVVCALHAAHAVGACFSTCAYDPAEIKELSAKSPPSHVIFAPPLGQMVLGDPELISCFRSLKRLIWVLGKLPDAIWETFESEQCRVIQLFGQGEGLCMVTPATASESVRRHTIGKPISDLDEVRVLLPGTEVQATPGEQGELCCRGPYTLRGYFRAPERNREAFTSDGFYRSGDIVVALDDSGERWYSIEDRLKDLISRGGEKINAVEVEQLLLRHKDIDAAAIVAMPDPRLGERACACIVVGEGAGVPTVEELANFLDGLGVAKFKWPERVEGVPELPYTSVDKINKVALRAAVAERVAAETSA